MNNIFNIGSQKAGGSIVNVSDTKIHYDSEFTTIYKYELKLKDNQTIELPGRAKILTVQVQYHTNIVLWALVNPELPTEKRSIRIIGTGHKINNNESLKYISTIQMEGGSLVWHIFETTANYPEEM